MRFAPATRLAVLVVAVPWLGSNSRGSTRNLGFVAAADMAPLLAYALPDSFPALDNLMSDKVSLLPLDHRESSQLTRRLELGPHLASPQLPSPLVFIPGVDPCGSLLVISIPRVHYKDLSLFPPQRINSTSGALLGSGLIDSFELAPTKGIAQAVSGRHVLDWADAWVKTCAGTKNEEYMNELKVAKVYVDWDQAVGSKPTREGEAMARLDQELAAHLTALPNAPHPHLVLLTSLTPRQLMHLMDLSSQTSHPPPQPIAKTPRLPPFLSTPKVDVARHASSGNRLSHFFWMVFRLAFWGIVLGGAAMYAKQHLEQRRMNLLGFRRLGTENGLPH
ncbi:BZ3500_MvSof-1268-A1-R1_Chr8-2g10109 [Microbotryum saponariae]|uniref:BZ3500_MvSof-1268-A1-R1_Chr8-2g10109 protein n=1 Tax=Microbotryum saponariae TaxID=289078 RepID=A0A2X0L5B8_9BASI|nr:BZ3500_MvSof-1268-A1-R1_Chr8-2g10109 [Microbotryum saponariae]SDA01804.1 BZ3501_MvSof-1269-A2-R1_Chr8-2g09860 [Microbotryum saponariae]